MPSLAEPKRKNRIGLNPRGTLWSSDENKFGQKLLEKMGWAKGEGLGKEGQGLKEPIRVTMNSENKGVGFKGNTEDESRHYQGLEDVLAGLNSVNSTENETEQNLSDGQNNLENVESLEIKSKNLKSRVHYKKFTRSKDLSRYNEDDLACVLGSKRAAKKENKETVKEEEETQQEIGQSESSNGLTTVYGGNLKDYFTHKMAELKRKREEGILGDGVISEIRTPSRSKKNRLGSVPSTPFPDLEFEPQRTEFSFNYSVNEPELEVEPKCESGSPELGKKKKKKKKSKDCDLEAEEAESIDTEKKKKKHKKDKKVKSGESDKENIIQEEISENIEKQKEENLSIDCEVKSNEEECKKKKKKRKNKDVEIECNSIDVSEVSIKKKKKKRKEREAENESEAAIEIHDNNCANENSGNQKEEKLNNDCENQSIDKGEKKKKKKHKSKDVELESSSIDESEISVKKKKKKKEKHESENDCETGTEINTSCNNIDIYLPTEMNESYLQATCKEDKMKKKKRKDRNEDEESIESEKPLRKLKKLASEISLTDIFSMGEKIDNRRNDVDENATAIEGDEMDQEEKKPRVKLTSKRSFKELKNDLEKLRKKVMKRSRKDLNTIEEEENKLEELANNQINIEANSTEFFKSTEVKVNVPVRENEEGYQFKVKNFKSVKVEVGKLFPSSNLPSITGCTTNV